MDTRENDIAEIRENDVANTRENDIENTRESDIVNTRNFLSLDILRLKCPLFLINSVSSLSCINLIGNPSFSGCIFMFLLFHNYNQLFQCLIDLSNICSIMKININYMTVTKKQAERQRNTQKEQGQEMSNRCVLFGRKILSYKLLRYKDIKI